MKTDLDLMTKKMKQEKWDKIYVKLDRIRTGIDRLIGSVITPNWIYDKAYPGLREEMYKLLPDDDYSDEEAKADTEEAKEQTLKDLKEWLYRDDEARSVSWQVEKRTKLLNKDHGDNVGQMGTFIAGEFIALDTELFIIEVGKPYKDNEQRSQKTS